MKQVSYFHLQRSDTSPPAAPNTGRLTPYRLSRVVYRVSLGREIDSGQILCNLRDAIS